MFFGWVLWNPVVLGFKKPCLLSSLLLPISGHYRVARGPWWLTRKHKTPIRQTALGHPDTTLLNILTLWDGTFKRISLHHFSRSISWSIFPVFINFETHHDRAAGMVLKSNISSHFSRAHSCRKSQEVKIFFMSLFLVPSVVCLYRSGQ